MGSLPSLLPITFKSSFGMPDLYTRYGRHDTPIQLDRLSIPLRHVRLRGEDDMRCKRFSDFHLLHFASILITGSFRRHLLVLIQLIAV